MSTKPSKTPTPKSSAAAALWRSKGPLIAAFVGIGIVGIAIGRVTAPAREPTAPSPEQTASAAPEPPQAFDLTDDPRSPAGIPLRPMDREIFEQIMKGKVERTRMKDVFPDRPYRVSFVGSDRRIGAVLIDFDRDGKFEERWDLKTTGVVRMVHKDPATEGQPMQYSLAHGRWQPH